MRTQLRSVGLSGDWAPLLKRLHGWRCRDDHVWSDGVSEIFPRESRVEAFGFVTAATHPIRAAGIDSLPKTALRQSPAGLVLSVVPAPNRGTPLTSGDFILNHVAINVGNIAAEAEFFENLLGRTTVLRRESAWNPVAEDYRPDVHLYRDDDFYITIRGGFTAPSLDHAGWMASTRIAVGGVALILKELHWPIVLGPLEIDGSYLVHFRGPDGLVHDFFCPTAKLRERSQLPSRTAIGGAPNA